MAEHSAVNRRVVSSSLTCGANSINKLRAFHEDGEMPVLFDSEASVLTMEAAFLIIGQIS